MAGLRRFVACSLFIAGMFTVSSRCIGAKKLLVVSTPYGHSHLMGLTKQAVEVAKRGHEVAVSRLHQTNALESASCFSLSSSVQS